MVNVSESLNILLYHSTPFDVPVNLSLVTSPIACLSEATQKSFDLVAIAFHGAALKEREALVELCSVLRKNPHTAETPLLALIPSRHRNLLAGLKDAGVEHAMLPASLGSTLPAELRRFVESRSGGTSIARMLAEICPYINYVPINRRREMLYCQAYRNRLVLGPYLLNAYCEIPGHSSCPYYVRPQFAKQPSGTAGKERQIP